MEKKKLFVGTPMYGGQCYGAYANSCINLLNLLNRVGVEVMFYYLYDDALVPRARNTIVHEFLKTDCTHLLFIDADIQFQPEHVLSLLQLDTVDIVGGPYAKKQINWTKAATVVRDIPDINPDDIEKFVGEYVFNSKKPLANLNELHPVEEIGAGFMLIPRYVFLKMEAAYPQLKYKVNKDKETYNFFLTAIDSAGSLTGGGTDRYLSEDYAFCLLWKKMGGNIMLAPWVALKHIGNYAYTCDFPFIIQSYLNKKEEKKKE